VKRREANAVRLVLCVYVLNSDGAKNKDVEQVDIAVGSQQQKTVGLASEHQMMLARPRSRQADRVAPRIVQKLLRHTAAKPHIEPVNVIISHFISFSLPFLTPETFVQ
jgi:hypothetical protein